MKVLYLTSLIKSYIPGFCEERRPANNKWIEWYTNLKKMNKQPIIFNAKNKDEYVKEMLFFLPYLNEDDIIIIYEKIKEKNEYSDDINVYFASPSLITIDSYRILYSCEEYPYKNTFRLDTNNKVIRLPSSYTDNQLHGESQEEHFLFHEKAIDYSKKFWPEYIRVQPDMCYVTYIFANSGKPYGIGELYRLYVGRHKYMHDDNYRYFKSLDIHEVHDNELCLITHDRLLFDEINSDGYSSKYIINTQNGLPYNNNKSIIKEELKHLYPGTYLCNSIYTYMRNNEDVIRKINDPEEKYKDIPFFPDLNVLLKTRE